MSPSLTVAALAAYLVGSLPFGLILSKAFGSQDPRNYGSGNIGATNVMRTGGKLLGALTLLADVLKGLVPVALVVWAGWQEAWVATIALAVFIGHLFPLFLKFRGGKGVATMLGVMLPWQPVASLLGLALWVVLLKLYRYVSLASVLAALSLPLLVWITGASGICILASIVIAVMVTVRHAANIGRLKAGTEPKIGSKQPRTDVQD